ncbi:PREDICTED: gametogenetin [Elephantulus edwardii]|uniref:gametogenetin n=1 Tax=Elephantulus edwardii TaxID=28737 RepID=UPI0003F07E0F|nr:PREDICTED: gametogenetin [Elephantulus edwardii]
MGNVQSEPAAGGGSRKEQASDRACDSRRISLVEPEVTPSSPAMRLARGLGVWFPSSSAPPGLLMPPEPQASPMPLPLTLDLPTPVTPPAEEAAAAAVSTSPPPPVGTLLPAPSKWRKPMGTPVPRIRGLLEASHRGQGDPPSLRPLPLRPRQLTEEEPAPSPSTSSRPSPPVEPRKPPPPPPPPPPDRRTTPAPAAPAAPAATPPESQAGSESRMGGGARRAAPSEAGGGEMARPTSSESGLNLLCKVTFKSAPPLSPAAASGALGAKASLGGGGGGGLFPATSGTISYAEVLKQGALAPESPRPSGETPRGSQEVEGGDGDGEGCSGLPSPPAPHARALPPPPYTTFQGSKPKFDWVSPLDGSERHFRFNGAGGGVGQPRRRAAALSGPWGSPPQSPRGQAQLPPGPRRPAPAVLAPPMFIFPAPTNDEPGRPAPPGPQELLPPPPPVPPRMPPPTPPPTPQPPPRQPTPLSVALLSAPDPGHVESASALTQDPAAALALTTDPAPDPAPAPAPGPAPDPAPTAAEPPPPAPVKGRTRRSKGPRAARAATRDDGTPQDGPRKRSSVIAADGRAGGHGAPPAGMANSSAMRHWPPFEVLNSCPCKCYCRHQPRHRRLPRNVSAWLSTPTNHLSEPPWVATIKLAGSLVAGLDHYDLQATHPN